MLPRGGRKVAEGLDQELLVRSRHTSHDCRDRRAPRGQDALDKALRGGGQAEADLAAIVGRFSPMDQAQ